MLKPFLLDAGAWFPWVVATLACYRLAQLVTIDEGPFGVFKWLRILAGVYDRNQQGTPKRWLGRLWGCPYCIGLWLALGCTYLVLRPTFAGDLFLATLAVAGAQSWLQGHRNPL